MVEPFVDPVVRQKVLMTLPKQQAAIFKADFSGADLPPEYGGTAPWRRAADVYREALEALAEAADATGAAAAAAVVGTAGGSSGGGSDASAATAVSAREEAPSAAAADVS